jgi:hypothetical protein
LQRSAFNESSQVMTSTSLTVAGSNREALPAARRETPVPHPAFHHALRAAALQSDWATRAMHNASASAQVFSLGIDAESAEELLQMQHAAWERLFSLQSSWAQDWKNWIQYSDLIKGANTTFKFVEREGNILAQCVQLLSKQAADLMGLQENINVDYSFWINQKLSEKQTSLSASEK